MPDRPLADIAIEDLVAVRGYISEDHEVIDRALRAVDLDKLKDLNAYIRVATYGLFQLAPCRGPVFRGAQLAPDAAAKYLPGMLIREHAFVSATANPALRFGGNTTFVIESVNGRDVSPIAEKPIEREVVFFTGTRFKVLGVDREAAAGEATIYLREVADPRLLRDAAAAGPDADDEAVLQALRRAAETRERLALPLRLAAGRPQKHSHPVGMDDRGSFFPVPQTGSGSASG